MLAEEHTVHNPTKRLGQLDVNYHCRTLERRIGEIRQ